MSRNQIPLANAALIGHWCLVIGHLPMLYFRMGRLFETVTDLRAGAETLRRRRYGIIEVRGGQFTAIHLRPWPKFVSLLGAMWGQRYHGRACGDRIWLYYNQPRRHPSFLALKYVVSSRNTAWASIVRASAVLDEIAAIKRSDALLCDAANLRLTPRLLARLGWQPHAPSRWHHNYIKRLDKTVPPLQQKRQSADTLALMA